jgi:hypothetical protein
VTASLASGRTAGTCRAATPCGGRARTPRRGRGTACPRWAGAGLGARLARSCRGSRLPFSRPGAAGPLLPLRRSGSGTRAGAAGSARGAGSGGGRAPRSARRARYCGGARSAFPGACRGFASVGLCRRAPCFTGRASDRRGTFGSQGRFLLAERTLRGLRLFRCGSPDHQKLSDHLDRCASENRADAFHDPTTLFPVIAQNPDLDQLMAIERASDLGEHPTRESRIADHHDRIEMVGLGAEFATLGGRQRGGRRRSRFSGVGCCGAGRGPVVGRFVWHATRSWKRGGPHGRSMLQPQ